MIINLLANYIILLILNNLNVPTQFDYQHD